MNIQPAAYPGGEIRGQMITILNVTPAAILQFATGAGPEMDYLYCDENTAWVSRAGSRILRLRFQSYRQNENS